MERMGLALTAGPILIVSLQSGSRLTIKLPFEILKPRRCAKVVEGFNLLDESLAPQLGLHWFIPIHRGTVEVLKQIPELFQLTETDRVVIWLRTPPLRGGEHVSVLVKVIATGS